jgi:hypothetical protein
MNMLSAPPIQPSPIQHRLEVELLLCCARTHLSDVTRTRIRTIIQEDLDWSYLVLMAVRHRLTSLLHRHLNAICSTSIPSEILANLQQHSQLIALQNLVLTQELLKLLDVLKHHGIRAIPFKGPILTATLYGNPVLRRFGDLDIWVHEQDFWKTRDLLLTQGYHPTLDPWFNNDAQEMAYFQSRNEYALTREDGEVSIDLHRQLAAGDFFLMPFAFEKFWGFDRVWNRLKPVVICNQTVLSLPPEDLLIFLCIHGSKHLWERLSWVCDIAELIRTHPDLDWHWILEQADQLRCDRMVSLGLFLAHELLEAPLPATIQQRIQATPSQHKLADQVYSWLFSEVGVPAKGFSLARIRFHLQEIQHWPDKLCYACRSLGHYGLAPIRRMMTPTLNDRSFLPLPPLLYGLYYLVRPVRLIGKAGATTINRWRTNP